MTKQEYEHMKRELRRDYEDKLASLEKLWAVFGPKRAVAAQNGHAPGAATAWSHDMSKRDAVRSVLKHLHGEFNVHRVREVLSSTHPGMSKDITDNQLSANLSTLAERGEIQVVKNKVGRSPATYRNP